jgi:hypothetical protein
MVSCLELPDRRVLVVMGVTRIFSGERAASV